MHKFLLAALLLIALGMSPASAARKWSDATGKYTVEGDLVGMTDTTAVILKADKKKQLVVLRIAQLSKADQEYLKSSEAAEATSAKPGEQTWTMKSGLKVNARAVDYGRRDVTLQRRRGSIFVNDRMFDNLDGVQQKVVQRIVSHFESIPVESKKDLEAWILKYKGAAKTFTCDGVLLQLDNGDEYGVPFFLFSDADLKVLEPGWQQWLAARTKPRSRSSKRRSRRNAKRWCCRSKPNNIRRIAKPSTK